MRDNRSDIWFAVGENRALFSIRCTLDLLKGLAASQASCSKLPFCRQIRDSFNCSGPPRELAKA